MLAQIAVWFVVSRLLVVLLRRRFEKLCGHRTKTDDNNNCGSIDIDVNMFVNLLEFAVQGLIISLVL